MKNLLQALVYISCCLLFSSTQAFVVVSKRNVFTPSITSSSSSSSWLSSTLLQATKRRRRKRNDNDSNESSESSSSFNTNDNELPDFDLGDDDNNNNNDNSAGIKDNLEKKTSSKPKKAANLDEITVNMMGSSNQPTRSINDLLRDRSLEQKFQFDDVESDTSLPDLADLARSSASTSTSSTSTVSRKEQRRLAAQARDASKSLNENTENEPLQLPFDMTNDKGEIQFNKVLEAGAWLGIFLLIGWEIYINSPFFERAAPMAPIVYESPPKF